MSGVILIPECTRSIPPRANAISNPSWFALYTRPRHEKAVAEQCRQRGVEAFLPLYTAQRIWKQRRAEVQLPLFPSYVFVRMNLIHKLKVLTIPSTVSLVSFQGIPAIVPDEQMKSLSNAVLHRKVEPHDYLSVGKRIRVKRGPFAGLEGIIERWKGSIRVVVSFDWMCRSVAVLLDAADLEKPFS